VEKGDFTSSGAAKGASAGLAIPIPQPRERNLALAFNSKAEQLSSSTSRLLDFSTFSHTSMIQLKDKGISTIYIILLVAVVILALTAAVVLVWHSHVAAELSANASIIPTEEQKAYFPQIEITDAHMSAAENFLGASVTYLDAHVRNRGTKTVRRLDLELTFIDMLNQVVLRERAQPVTRRSLPLKPGESRAFRVSFEHMPPDWNQAAPTMTPVYLQF